MQPVEQPRRLRGDRGRGQPVADHHLEVAPRRAAAADDFAGVVVETPAEVRAAQVFGLRGGTGSHVEQREPRDPFPAEVAEQIDLGVNRVAGGGVVLPELQPRRRPVRRPRPADRGPRRRAGEQRLDRVAR